MTAKHIVTLILLLAGLSVTATPLTPQQALSNIDSQNSKGGVFNAFSFKGSELQHAFTLCDSKNAPLVYAYNVKSGTAGEGFVIASADDNAFPVLGYVEKGSFNEADIPIQLREMMEYYGREIEWLRSAEGQLNRQPIDWTMLTKEAKQEVKPMVKTVWGQGNPYNLMCPRVDNNLSVTGCMATAIAQVCAYWHWPLKGSGTGKAYCNGKRYTWDLSKIKFNYLKMTTYYNERSTKAQQEAVAKLMAACGYTVGMNYSPSASAASATVTQLVNHLNYSPSARLILRDGNNEMSWINELYASLAAGSPIIIWGYGSNYQNGHAFVIDGYRGLGYFHVNWGWNGNSDGFYRLSALAPRNDSRNLNFSYHQYAIVGLKPNRPSR